MGMDLFFIEKRIFPLPRKSKNLTITKERDKEKMPIRFAFAGFRHGHVFGLYDKVFADRRAEIVAAAEFDPETCGKLAAEGHVHVTDSREDSLFEKSFDVLAVGDAYSNHGRLALRALRSGRHVITDKPLCTTLKEFDEIRHLAAEKKLCIGCILDLRQSVSLATARKLILGNVIGDIQSVGLNAQHSLNYGIRPDWYFKPGGHGGIFNDIGIHAVDAVEWATGRILTEATAARAWNAFAGMTPLFQDAGQAMLRFDNQGGMLMDISYFAPNSCGSALPTYWSWLFWGSKGVISCSYRNPVLMLTREGASGPEAVPPCEEAVEPDYYECFMAELEGRQTGSLDTARVIEVTRKTLRVQQTADRGLRDVTLF